MLYILKLNDEWLTEGSTPQSVGLPGVPRPGMEFDSPDGQRLRVKDLPNCAMGQAPNGGVTSMICHVEPVL